MSVFENRLLRGIFASRRTEAIGGRRKLQNEETHNLYFSPNFTVTKSRKIGWAGHAVRSGEMRNVTGKNVTGLMM